VSDEDHTFEQSPNAFTDHFPRTSESTIIPTKEFVLALQVYASVGTSDIYFYILLVYSTADDSHCMRPDTGPLVTEHLSLKSPCLEQKQNTLVEVNYFDVYIY